MRICGLGSGSGLGLGLGSGSGLGLGLYLEALVVEGDGEDLRQCTNQK